MMLHPSYVELMDKVNEGAPEGETVINSRYSIVLGTAKRARQIIAADNKLIELGELSKADPRPKALSTAVAELANDKIHIVSESSENYESYVPDENGKV